WGHYYQGLLAVDRGDVAGGLALLRAALEQLGEARFAARFVSTLGDVAVALGRAGHIAEGLRALEEPIARFAHGEAGWRVPPLLRSGAELLLLQGGDDATAAGEDHLRLALARARSGDALVMALRAATVLARLLCNRGHPAEATALLQPIYDRFSEGF